MLEKKINEIQQTKSSILQDHTRVFWNKKPPLK